ncbi:MAG: DNA repair protein RecO [Kiritimatiellae bacterium]|nr:DNA repair protein RecO [Kiritimatiellia bacterium]
MAGQTEKACAICIDIHPYSRTSHIVNWLTEKGILSTLVKGAVRPKSQFLGQYDLNYTCDIIYYSTSKSDLHPLKECLPIKTRDYLRDNYKQLACASYFRAIVNRMCPYGEEARNWFDLLTNSLDNIDTSNYLQSLLKFDLKALKLSGILPDFRYPEENSESALFSLEYGRFNAGGRSIRISKPTANYLQRGANGEKNLNFLLEALRVIGVYYTFHVDLPPQLRRITIDMISK